jgi:hypothetical protein
MQAMMTANSSAAQQSVIQGTSPMNVNQQSSANPNALLYTATIYSQDMSQNNQQQQMMSMQQNRQQTNDSAQAMMTDLNPFISGGMGMSQQQAQQTSEQMMASQADDDDKEAYKGKFSRGYLRQLP